MRNPQSTTGLDDRSFGDSARDKVGDTPRVESSKPPPCDHGQIDQRDPVGILSDEADKPTYCRWQRTSLSADVNHPYCLRPSLCYTRAITSVDIRRTGDLRSRRIAALTRRAHMAPEITAHARRL
jgi:hypothetical protein